jgi:hypothetical protein
MKTKIKQTITNEVEVDIQLPAYFRTTSGTFYYRIKSENEVIQVHNIEHIGFGISTCHISTVFSTPSEPITSEEFETFFNDAIKTISIS